MLLAKLTAEEVGKYALQYLSGLGNTLLISLGAVIIGIILGFVIALVKFLAKKQGGTLLKIFDKVCDVYIAVIRGTPMLLQLLIMYFFILTFIRQSIIVAIIAFGFNSSAYVAEIARAGLEGVDSGQMEAGKALGFSTSMTMIHIIIPQAVKSVIPPMGNEFIVLIKETSVAGYIAVIELTRVSDLLRLKFGLTPLLISAGIYLVLVLLLTWGLKVLERRLSVSDRDAKNANGGRDKKRKATEDTAI